MAQGVKLDDVVRQDIARLVQEGQLSGNQIAKQLGISRDATQKVIKELKQGFPPSPRQSQGEGPDSAPTPTALTPELSPVALVIDPEFHGLIPALTGEARAQLELSLREEGCRDPLVVWPQPAGAPILLDGHNRHEICQQYGLGFAVIEARGISTRDDAKIWIITNQLGRRNLTDFQRIELAEKLRPLPEAKAKAKQQGGGREKVPQDFAEPVETRQAIAKIADVSRETVRKAEVIMAEADEPTKEALRRGTQDSWRLPGLTTPTHGLESEGGRRGLRHDAGSPDGHGAWAKDTHGRAADRVGRRHPRSTGQLASAVPAGLGGRGFPPDGKTSARAAGVFPPKATRDGRAVRGSRGGHGTTGP